MHYLIYITTPNVDEAKNLARQLVQKRLAACANILPQMVSVYRWQGQIEDAEECVLLAKTNANKRSELIRFIEQHHSYDVPCALAIPVESGAERYIAWLDDELKG